MRIKCRLSCLIAGLALLGACGGEAPESMDGMNQKADEAPFLSGTTYGPDGAPLQYVVIDLIARSADNGALKAYPATIETLTVTSEEGEFLIADPVGFLEGEPGDYLMLLSYYGRNLDERAYGHTSKIFHLQSLEGVQRGEHLEVHAQHDIFDVPFFSGQLSCTSGAAPSGRARLLRDQALQAEVDIVDGAFTFFDILDHPSQYTLEVEQGQTSELFPLDEVELFSDSWQGTISGC